MLLPSSGTLLALIHDWLRAAFLTGLLAWLPYVAYVITCEALWGTTPGKWLVGLYVAPGRPGSPVPPQQGLGWAQASTRFAAASLSWLTMNVGHALGHWRSDHAMLHDLVSRTQVVRASVVEFPGLPEPPVWLRPVARVGAWVLLALLLLAQFVSLVHTMTNVLNSVG
jgi:uncharacterized RDD family membrane protein YckC